MKYPYLSNWIEFKRIPDRDVYYVKNYVLDKSCYISSDKMSFAKRLDGKTHPISICGNRSVLETVDLLNELESLDIIRSDHGHFVTAGNAFMKTIVRTRNTKVKKFLSKILNTLLLISFIPILLAGIYVYWHSRFIGYSTTLIDSTPLLIIFNVLSIISAGTIHELCHGIACRAYGGKVFEYGYSISLVPCFYTLLDYSNVSSRLKKIQINVAGVEGNLLLSGILLMLSGLLPGFRIILFYGAWINIVMTLINMLAISGTDGMKILLLIIGFSEDCGINKLKLLTRKRRKKNLLKKEGILGCAKVAICYTLLLLQTTMPILIITDITFLIRSFI